MINVLAIDDEPLALQQIASYIKDTPYLELKGQCQSALEARRALQDNPIDAIFIDINMPDLNGLDFVRSLPDAPLVVFTTAYGEYALDSYKVNAVDYLLKPFGMTEFRRAAEKVRKQHELLAKAQGAQADIAKAEDDDALFLKTEHRVLRIEISDIEYVESMSEYLKIHLASQPKPIIILLSMKRIEERLPARSFIRIHRGYIINLKKIREVNKNRVILTNDTYLPIGDLYRDALMAYINRNFLGK